MALELKSKSEPIDIDMTPMIDMTFQLIAFFMILINFEAQEQDARIKLPESELAKPPKTPTKHQITVQLTQKGEAILAGSTYADRRAIIPVLNNERYVLETQNVSPADATIVVRAHMQAKTGEVQDLIKICQEAKFEKFTLRAMEKVGF
jgi:biopolymer transport protein ExbD